MYDENKQRVLSLLGIFKIKYSVLDELDISDIDVFHIDVNTIIGPLFKPKELFEDTDEDFSFTISSSILNLVAHYRAYFAKNKKNVPIYLYYSNKKTRNKKLEKHLNNSMVLIKTIVKYIPKVYFIDDERMDIKLGIEYFINNNEINYIFTKNRIFYQFLTNDNVYILRPSRDDTYVIRKDNLYNKLTGNYTDYAISPELLTAILAIAGTNEYKGIKGMGIKKTLKLFQRSIRRKDMVNSYYINIDDLIDDLSLNDKCDDQKYLIYNNFINIDVRALKSLNPNYKYDIICNSYIIDKFSKKDLQELNIKYFTGFNSLMLQELLLEVEKPKKKKKKNKISW